MEDNRVARINQAEAAHEVLNDFLPKVMALLSEYVPDHGRHATMCDSLNNLKVQYCNDIRNGTNMCTD